MDCFHGPAKCNKSLSLKVLPCDHVAVCQRHLKDMMSICDKLRECPACHKVFSKRELKHLEDRRWPPKNRGPVVGGTLSLEKFIDNLDGEPRKMPPSAQPQPVVKAATGPRGKLGAMLGKRKNTRTPSSSDRSASPQVRLPPDMRTGHKTASSPRGRTRQATSPKPKVQKTVPAAKRTRSAGKADQIISKGMMLLDDCLSEASQRRNALGLASLQVVHLEPLVVRPAHKVTKKNVASQTTWATTVGDDTTQGVINIMPGATVPVINFHTRKGN